MRAVITNADYPIVSNTSIDLAEVLMNARVMAENDLAGEKVPVQGPRGGRGGGGEPACRGGGAST